MFKRLSLAIVMASAAAAPAFAHLDPTEHGSFAAGLTHPLSGLDHVLAMLAVGLWAVQVAHTGRRGAAVWVVPAAFVATMILGFALSLAGLALPFVEPAVLASVVVLGLLVAASMQLPVGACAALVGVFALFHGNAHGGELGTAGELPFGLGFVVATGFLHATGIAVGTLAARVNGRLVRAFGAATALLGLTLALG